MPTRVLMIASAAMMFLLGVLMTFAPNELLAASGVAVAGEAALFVQAAGALYLGFAVLNWMAKDNLIGGIYSRPVALGNLLQFFTLGMALLKVSIALHHPAGLLGAIVYLGFAGWFGWVAFTTPSSVAVQR